MKEQVAYISSVIAVSLVLKSSPWFALIHRDFEGLENELTSC